MKALLDALAIARRDMPALPRSEQGEDFHGKYFYYPSESDLQAAVDLVFAANNLMEVPAEATFANSTLTLTWMLWHLPSGEQMAIKMAWPVFERDQGYISRAHATAATWSHAWRHFMVKLLRPQVLAAGEVPRRPSEASPVKPATSAEMDRDLGPEPVWASTSPPDVPWRALQRVEESRAAAPSPEAQWEAVGAVADVAPPRVEDPPAFDPQPLMEVWAEFCARVPASSRRGSVLAYWHEFSGRTDDALVPHDNAKFKAYLRCQSAEAA